MVQSSAQNAALTVCRPSSGKHSWKYSPNHFKMIKQFVYCQKFLGLWGGKSRLVPREQVQRWGRVLPPRPLRPLVQAAPWYLPVQLEKTPPGCVYLCERAEHNNILVLLTAGWRSHTHRDARNNCNVKLMQLQHNQNRWAHVECMQSLYPQSFCHQKSPEQRHTNIWIVSVSLYCTISLTVISSFIKTFNSRKGIFSKCSWFFERSSLSQSACCK